MKNMLLKSCLLGVFLTFFVAGPGFTQTGNDKLRYVKIILANGTVLKGFIGKSIGENIITINPGWDSIDSYDIPFHIIKSMDFGKYRTASENREFKPPVRPVTSEPGFYHVFSFGLSMGENETNLTLGSENGYRMNDHFAGGLGVNYDRYTNISSLPVYLNLRGYLRNKKVSPYYFLGGGYGFAWDNGKEYAGYLVHNVKGGLYGQTGIGYQVQFSNTAISFNIGYKVQKAALDYEYRYYYQPWMSVAPDPSDPNMIVLEKRQIRRLFVSLSVVF